MKYKRIKYPDGQVSVQVEDFNPPWEIKERINSYEDLMFISSLSEVIKDNFRNIPIHIEIPCLFGQRSDRRFIPNQSLDIKVICNIINSWDFESVTVLDPHSYFGLGIARYRQKSSFEYVKATLTDINGNTVLVSPDAGAYKKVFEYGEKLNLEVLAAVKHRSLNGDIEMQFTGDVKDKNCLILDDLCDGGYTFIVLSKKLKEQGAKKIYLYVTHAYFSKGIDVLKENISHIYCTNSVKDITDSFITQYKVI